MKRLTLEVDWNYYKIAFFIAYIYRKNSSKQKGEWVVDIKAFLRHFLKVIRKGLFKDWNVVRLMRI